MFFKGGWAFVFGWLVLVFFPLLGTETRQHTVHAELPCEYEQCPFCESSAILFVLWCVFVDSFQGEMAVKGAQFPKLNRISLKRRYDRKERIVPKSFSESFEVA